jgi:hypothetical protein
MSLHYLNIDNRDVQVFLDHTKLGDFVSQSARTARGKNGKIVVLERGSTLGEAMKVRGKPFRGVEQLPEREVTCVRHPSQQLLL